MSKQRIYWICQLLGWLLWFSNEAIGYYFLSPDKESFIEILMNCLVNVAICIGLTHYLRHTIQKYNWIELSISRLIPRIIGSLLAMTSILTVINLNLDTVILGDAMQDNPLLVIQYFTNLFKPLLMWMLIYNIYHYFENKKNTLIEKIRLESSVRETEAKVLRAQLNPHFMFNALNSIRALVFENPEKAQKGITQLSNILRSSLLADRRRTVSFGEEMKTVDDYLALEKIRYEERLEIRKNIATATLNIEVPPMMVQTLVENAIKHGISKPVKGGFVNIEAQLSNNVFVLNISNTGVLGSTDSGGFGLENTAHRLKLLFGDDANFRIYQLSSHVVCAETNIPQHKTVAKALS